MIDRCASFILFAHTHYFEMDHWVWVGTQSRFSRPHLLVDNMIDEHFINWAQRREKRKGRKKRIWVYQGPFDRSSFIPFPALASASFSCVIAIADKGQITLLLIYNRKEDTCEERKRTFKIALEGDFLAAISMFFMKLMGPIVQTYAPDRKHRVIYFMHACIQRTVHWNIWCIHIRPL